MATAEERSRAARIAALTRWSRESGRTAAERGQEGLRDRFRREVDPDGTLPPDERERRAERAYTVHMIRLSAAGKKTLRERSAAKKAKRAERVRAG